MDAVDLHTLSVADLAELVRQLQAANEQLLGSTATLSQLSFSVQQALVPGADSEQARGLLAMSQFLTVEHSDEELAAAVQRQSVDLFAVDDGVLFLADSDGGLTPVSLSGPLGGRPEAVEQIAAAARQAWETQSVVTLRGDVLHGPACVALPLTRRGRGIGAFVLARDQEGELSLAAEQWGLATIFAGVVAVACANMLHVAALRREARLLEALVEQRTRQLQGSRDVLRAVFDHLPQGVVLLDADGQVLAANTLFCEQILGRHPRDVVGRPYEQLRSELAGRPHGRQFEPTVVRVAGSAQQLVFWERAESTS